MPYSQEIANQIVVQSLRLMADQLEQEPPDYPFSTTLTVVWDTSPVNSAEEELGHVVLSVSLTEHPERADRIATFLRSPEFRRL